jgi:iron(III) transport system substrate-binding protein
MSPGRTSSRGILATRISLAAALALVALVVAGCPGPRPVEVTIGNGAESGQMTHDEIIAQARREGEVDWYTSLPERDANPIAAKFTAQYPFLTCRIVRESTFQISQRVWQEVSSAQPRADVLHVLDPGVFSKLEQSGRLYHYESSQARYLPPDYQSPGWWAACRAVVTVIALRKDDPTFVRAWSDLLNLPASVRIGIKDAETSGSAYATYYLLREKYGYSFWEKLAAHQLRVYRSELDMEAALRRREVDVLTGVMADTASAKASGMRIVWPSDGAPLVLGPVAILASATHPNAAKLLVDFMLSDDGQALIRDQTGAYPVRPGLTPPPQLKPLADIQVLRPRAPWDLYIALQPSLQTEYRTLFP